MVAAVRLRHLSQHSLLQHLRSVPVAEEEGVEAAVLPERRTGDDDAERPRGLVPRAEERQRHPGDRVDVAAAAAGTSRAATTTTAAAGALALARPADGERYCLCVRVCVQAWQRVDMG